MIANNLHYLMILNYYSKECSMKAYFLDLCSIFLQLLLEPYSEIASYCAKLKIPGIID